jgi:MraZ protein
MAQFLGTHLNKLDAKGRVSVPAPFRAALKEQSAGGTGVGAPLILRPSHQLPCIEVWPERAFEALANPMGAYDQFSADQQDLATALYAEAHSMETDKEGRIVLPSNLKDHAGLGENIVFLGMGKIFQIWEPAAAERRLAEARERVRERQLTLPATSRVATTPTSATVPNTTPPAALGSTPPTAPGSTPPAAPGSTPPAAIQGSPA